MNSQKNIKHDFLILFVSMIHSVLFAESALMNANHIHFWIAPNGQIGVNPHTGIQEGVIYPENTSNVVYTVGFGYNSSNLDEKFREFEMDPQFLQKQPVGASLTSD